MNFSVEATAYFAKQLKRLSKKFPSLKDEFKYLINSLKENPKQGTSLGNNCFKIRLAIRSKGKGKSGGSEGDNTYSSHQVEGFSALNL